MPDPRLILSNVMSDSATPLDAASHAPGLAELLARQQLYRRLEADLRRQLPAALAGRIDVSCVHDGGELVLFAPHGAAATRLRATQQRLLTALQARGWAVRQLTVKVRSTPPSPLRDKQLAIGPAGQEALQQAAGQVAHHPALALALARLLARQGGT